MSPERIRPGSAPRIRPGSAGQGRTVAEPPPAGPVETATPVEEVPEPTAPLQDRAAPTLEEQVVADPAPATFTVFEDAVAHPAPAPATPGAAEAVPGAGEPALLEVRPADPAAPARHLGRFARLYYGRTRFEFVRRTRWWFLLSATVIVAGALSLGVRGLNLGIDFVGGTAWTVQSRTMTVAEARTALTPFGDAGATITILGQTSSSRQIEVQARLPKGQTPGATQREASTVGDALAKAAHVAPSAVSISTVGPSWGSQVTNKAIIALVVFFICIAVYISIFFEWRMALAALAAVAHDVLVTVGIYSLTGFQVTPDTVVAFLTILGYSLYDTIVVFDRVRDNTKQLGSSGKLSYSDLVNLSMNQTLARSINTSLVAILPILSVLVLGAYVLGATTLEYFGLALLIGLTTGAYSSIFIASPLVALMKEREPRWRNVRERLAQRGTDRLLLSPADIAAGLLGQDIEVAGTPSSPRAATRRAPARPTRGAPVRRPAPARRKGGRR